MKISMQKQLQSKLAVFMSIIFLLSSLPVLDIQSYADTGTPTLVSGVGSGALYARSATVTEMDGSKSVYLGGTYMELGISSEGSFGTQAHITEVGDTLWHPASITSSQDRGLGMVSNADGTENGWNTITTDYFMPGVIDEAWTLGYGKSRQARGSKYANNSSSGSSGIKSAKTVDASTSRLLKAVTDIELTSGVTMQQTVSFTPEAKYYITDVTIVNTTDTTLTGARYMRTFDPDQNALKVSPKTNNVIGHEALDAYGTSVIAYGKPDTETTPFIFFSLDERAHAGYCKANSSGSGSLSFSGIYNDTDIETEKGKQAYMDTDILIYFDLGDIAPGESVQLSYLSSLDTNIEDALNGILAYLNVGIKNEKGQIEGLEANETYTVTSEDGETWTIEIDENGAYIIKDSDEHPLVIGASIQDGIYIVEPWYEKKITLVKDSDGISADINLAAENRKRGEKPAEISIDETKGELEAIVIQDTKPGQQYAIYNKEGTLITEWIIGNGGTLSFEGLTPGEYILKTRESGGGTTLPSPPTDGVIVKALTELEKAKLDVIDRLKPVYDSYDKTRYDDEGKAELLQAYEDGKAAIGAAEDLEKAESAFWDAVDAMAAVITKNEKDLRAAAAKAAEQINGLKNISNDKKLSSKNEIEPVKKDAIAAIRDAAIKALSDAAYQNGKNQIDEIVREAVAEDAKIEIDTKAKRDKEIIDTLTDLSEAERKSAKADVDRESAKAKQAIDAAGLEDIPTEKTTGITTITAITDAAIALDLANAKRAANQAISTVATGVNQFISAMTDLTKKQKNSYQNKIQAIVTKAAADIAPQTDKAEIIRIREEAIKAINEVFQEATHRIEIIKTTIPLKQAEKEITTTNTDVKDPVRSSYAKLRLKAKAKNKAIQLTWKKIKDADGYIIYGARCGTNMKRLKTIQTNKNKYTMKKLKKGKFYKYIVSAYCNVDGKKRVIAMSNSVHSITNGGKYGNPNKVTAKKATLTVKKGKIKSIPKQLKPKLNLKKKTKTHIAKFRYDTTNAKIAKVTKSGRVKGIKKGKCYIYVYAQNGYAKRIKVSVN